MIHIFHWLWKILCCCCSATKSLCPTLWPCALKHTALPCPSLSPGVCSHACPSHWWCHPTSSSSVAPFSSSPQIPSIRVFSNELALPIRWPKYWSFNISPSSEYLGLISFRMDWFDLLAAQGTLKNLLQHHSLKASTLALRLLYGPTLTSIREYWKNHSLDYIDLCRQSEVSAF